MPANLLNELLKWLLPKRSNFELLFTPAIRCLRFDSGAPLFDGLWSRRCDGGSTHFFKCLYFA